MESKVISNKRKSALVTSAKIAVIVIGFGSLSVPDASADTLFKIYWQLGNQAEDIADGKVDQRQIDLTKSRVDGYFFNLTNPASPLSYWPDRPVQCTLNYKKLLRLNRLEPGTDHSFFVMGKSYNVSFMNNEYGPSNPENCERLRCEFLKKEFRRVNGTSDPTDCSTSVLSADLIRLRAQLDARATTRMLDVLNISEEQKTKNILAEMLLTNTDFSYDAGSDSLTLTRLPSTFDGLLSRGVLAKEVLAYQEPYFQIPRGSLLSIPNQPGGSTYIPPTSVRCLFCLPTNLRILNLLSGAFLGGNQTPPQLFVNSRVWDDIKDEPRFLAASEEQTDFGGLNIEGGAQKKYERILSNIRSIAFMLRNTDKEINLLTPASYGLNSDVGTEEALDNNAIKDMEDYLNLINRELSVIMGKKQMNAICSPRIRVIVGAYGNPVHPKAFPINRVDSMGRTIRKAGTVSGRILAVHQLRHKICVAGEQ